MWLDFAVGSLHSECPVLAASTSSTGPQSRHAKKGALLDVSLKGF